MEKKEITKEMNIAEVVEKYPIAAKILMEEGLGCIGCVASEFETLDEGLKAHGMDVKRIIDKINSLIEKDGNA